MNEAVPREVTKRRYRRFRFAKRGRAHAEKMNNPVWEWLVRCRLNAHAAGMAVTGDHEYPDQPRWCCDRFGQSETRLPDGLTVLVAGEHEDYYDPDFFVYNDVIIVGPDDSIDIFGYPEEDFPPTDFHSASQIGDHQIVLVGNLGYKHLRKTGVTQVYVLDLHHMQVSARETDGNAPGWISRHNAETQGTDIIIRGGEIHEKQICENFDEWKLDTKDWKWHRLTDRGWTVFEFTRQDESPHELFSIWAQHEIPGMDEKMVRLGLADLVETPPRNTDYDYFQRRYRPGVAHEVLPSREDEFNVYRVQIDGTTVRFDEVSWRVTMTIEGGLPEAIIDRLASELCDKLSGIEDQPWTFRVLDNR